MKSKDIRQLSLEELRTKERDLHQEIYNLNFQRHTGQLENVGKIRGVKRDLARLKTILHEKVRSGGQGL